MYEITIPKSRKLLFETFLEPAADTTIKLKAMGATEGMIEAFKGKENRVTIGQPYFELLIPRMQTKGEEISYEIKRPADKNDFHYVSTSCTLVPDRDCKIEWAKFGIDLYAIGPSSESTMTAFPSDASLDSSLSPSSTPPPLVYNLFPKEVLSEIKVKSKHSITAGLKIKVIPVEVGIGGSADSEQEYIIYQPQIIGSGVNTSKVVWDFVSTKEKAVIGDKEMLLVIQTPKGTKLKGRFLLKAQLSSLSAPKLKLLASPRKEGQTKAEYDLSE